MKINSLNIWMNGQPVGVWNPVKNTFQYDNEWCTSTYARSLSLSLPIAPGNPPLRGESVRNYFENLLPDSDAIRRRLASKFNAGSTDAADLLAAVGRDCVGAIQILPDSADRPDIGGIEGTQITDARIAEILRNTTSNQRMNMGDDDDGLRLSIAGAQEKNALLNFNGQWFIPHGTTPTTHILKLPLGLVGNMAADMSQSVENEWLCSRIVHHYSIPVASCEPLTFTDNAGTVKVLSVERFDRVFNEEAGVIIRLPQEDMCQAMGVNPIHKYEADGGPDALRIMQLLQFSETAEKDRRNFFKTLVVFWLLAATDGHAKNFSIFLRKGGKYAMTPLYDVLSAHPVIGRKANQFPQQKVKLAMSVVSKNRHYTIFKLVTRQWVDFGLYLGLPRAEVLHILTAVHLETPAVIAAVAAELPDDFPHTVSEPIFLGMTTINAKLRDVEKMW